MAKLRTPIPQDISAEVMFQHDSTCCVCRNRGLSVQIHHIDEDPTNHAIQNLAVLCLEDHDQTQTKGGFAKRLKAADIIRHRDDWVQRVRLRRDKAEEILLREMVGLEPRQQLQIEDWTSPSEARVVGFLHALPGLRKAAMTAAQPLWDTGITSEMCQGCYDAIDFLERAWLQLAKFYPPGHFDEKPSEQFFSEFISARFRWHRQIYEPSEPGSSGTLVREIVGGAVLDDVARTIAETVEGLYIGLTLNNFDLPKWRRDWDAARQLKR
jgi:hypothetical protein